MKILIGMCTDCSGPSLILYVRRGLFCRAFFPKQTTKAIKIVCVVQKDPVRAYTNGKASDQFSWPRVGSSSSRLVLYVQLSLYIVQANSDDPDQSALMRRLVRIFAVRLYSKVLFFSFPANMCQQYFRYTNQWHGDIERYRAK